mmetsp:Transcript_59/g.236  ORF Transcript_59/g.236 Transcript_59/m.236 type:complete len:209 (-) Transcript_59:2123-2749(-)
MTAWPSQSCTRASLRCTSCTRRAPSASTTISRKPMSTRLIATRSTWRMAALEPHRRAAALSPLPCRASMGRSRCLTASPWPTRACSRTSSYLARGSTSRAQTPFTLSAHLLKCAASSCRRSPSRNQTPRARQGMRPQHSVARPRNARWRLTSRWCWVSTRWTCAQLALPATSSPGTVTSSSSASRHSSPCARAAQSSSSGAWTCSLRA